MKRNTIRWVVIFAAISIIGIIAIQIYWVRQAYDLREKQFTHRVNLALATVTDKIMTATGDTTLLIDPIRQMASNFFILELNEPISMVVVESFLTSSFKESRVDTDFEFGLYDCVADTILEGEYIEFDSTFQTRPNRFGTVPMFRSNQSYVGVYFPKKDAHIMGQMGFWVFSSFILAVVIVFFAATTFIILRQKRLSEITRDFINNMTHEFKTPISTIGVSSEVLLKDPDVLKSDRLSRYSSIIQTENQRLKKQVERVLQMATLEKEDFQLNRESVDVHTIIDQAVSSVRLALEAKSGEIHCHTNAERSVIEADKVHLTNMIYNLLDNAIKYSGDHKPEITISTENEKRGICILVKDNGIGMKKEDLKHIFKKFYRVPTGNRHDVKGFGLGLAYVKMMAEAHGGYIHVDSEAGEGSTFSLFLPYTNSNT